MITVPNNFPQPSFYLLPRVQINTPNISSLYINDNPSHIATRSLCIRNSRPANPLKTCDVQDFGVSRVANAFPLLARPLANRILYRFRRSSKGFQTRLTADLAFPWARAESEGRKRREQGRLNIMEARGDGMGSTQEVT